MKKLKIITAPNPQLLKKAQKVEIFDENLKNFATNMLYTMEQADGCGLASIQIEDDPSFNLKSYGNFRPQPNVIIVQTPEETITAINAEILQYGSAIEIGQEGCLSFPGIKSRAYIERSETIQVQYQTLEGETIKRDLSGFIARIFQHEFDHNIGKIFPNRLEEAKEKFFWIKYLAKYRTAKI